MPRKFLCSRCSLLLTTGSICAQNQPLLTGHGYRLVNHTQGKGMKARQGESVVVHVDTYIGDTLMGSTRSDGGLPREYQLSASGLKVLIIGPGTGAGQMIPGIDEGVATLHHGAKACFFLPGELGYGEYGTPDGAVPLNAELIFYVELL